MLIVIRENVALDWTNECQQSFENLKQTVLDFMPVPELDPNKIRIHTDASLFAAATAIL